MKQANGWARGQKRMQTRLQDFITDHAMCTVAFNNRVSPHKATPYLSLQMEIGWGQLSFVRLPPTSIRFESDFESNVWWQVLGNFGDFHLDCISYGQWYGTLCSISIPACSPVTLLFITEEHKKGCTRSDKRCPVLSSSCKQGRTRTGQACTIMPSISFWDFNHFQPMDLLKKVIIIYWNKWILCLITTCGFPCPELVQAPFYSV